MTTKQEQYRIGIMIELYGNKCCVCGKQYTQRAHILSQGNHARKKFGNVVIDSPYNWRGVCSLKCNQKIALNYATWPIKAKEHAQRVFELETIRLETEKDEL